MSKSSNSSTRGSATASPAPSATTGKSEDVQKMRELLDDQPAQVTPEMKKIADRHPEDVPPPGDMGPDQGPSS